MFSQFWTERGLMKNDSEQIMKVLSKRMKEKIRRNDHKENGIFHYSHIRSKVFNVNVRQRNLHFA